jgi:membrane protease YdiL (CAAX protease family)
MTAQTTSVDAYITRLKPTLNPTTPTETLAWMRRDLAYRLIPFSMVVAGVWVWRRNPRWLGITARRPRLQMSFGVAGFATFFALAAALQLRLSRGRAELNVAGSISDAALRAGYYLVNAPIEEAFFRGLLQGGVGARFGGVAGFLAGTVPYVLYHRLGGWRWADVLATALVGVPLAVAYRRLPGGPSLLGVSLAHAGATCGFLGLGPWVLKKLNLL